MGRDKPIRIPGTVFLSLFYFYIVKAVYVCVSVYMHFFCSLQVSLFN